MFALPGSSYATRKVDTTVKKDVVWCLQLLRILTVGSGICCLTLFMMCDDNRYSYAGGNVQFDELGPTLDSTWVPVNDHDGFAGYNSGLYGTCSKDQDRDCKCTTEDYAPICANMSVGAGSDEWRQVAFFSPCHLGCRFDRTHRTMKIDAIQKRTTDVQQIVNECKCIGPVYRS